MITSEVIIRSAAPDHVPALAADMAQAFYDEPADKYVFPDESTRLERQTDYYTALLQWGLTAGRVDTTEQLDGAAIWLPGNCALPADIDEKIRAACADSCDRLLNLFGTVHYRPPHTSFAELLFIAAFKQNSGIGTALLRHQLGNLDLLGIPAYLEASNKNNRRLYERLGFYALDEVHLQSGITLYPMWREPQALAKMLRIK